MRAAILAAFTLVACKGKSESPKQETPVERPLAQAKSIAKVTPLATNDAEGRCVNETPGRTFDAVYFYPSRAELFVPTSKGSAFRLPIRIEPGKATVELTYKWAADEKAPATSHPGAVTIRDDGKLKFQLETIQESVCTREPFPTFLLSLDKLGVPAGNYRDDSNRDEITFVAGEQKMLSKERDKETPAFYRVASHDPSGATTLYVSNEPPNSGRPTVWVEWKVTSVGGTIVVDYMGRFKRTYKKIQ